ncbi:MAG TPA: hypothetical protein VII73_13910 [Caulobacteraceae bacterium]
MIRKFWLVLAALALLCAGPAAAKGHLFESDAPLKMVITAPFPALVRADARPSPFAASLTVSDAGGAPESLPVQLTARGHSRRTLGYCTFPPLWLTFDKDSARGTLFSGQKKLKLTTYCRPGADYEQRIVLEYLAYRLYNLITPISFRARPAEVTYRTSDADPGVTRFGFLIEDDNRLADRNDAIRLKAASHQVSMAQMDAHATERAALFEFMIGNFDWEFMAAPAGVDCCHNSRFIAAKDATVATARGVAPAPYDFDSSGFVDAPYAAPPPSLGISHATDRVYRGYCADNGEIASVAAEFQAQRAAMTAIIDGETRLNDRFRAKADRFMDGFFAVLDDPARVQREIVKRCR